LWESGKQASPFSEAQLRRLFHNLTSFTLTKQTVAERTGPQALFSLGVVSRKPALSEAEGDLLLFFKEHLGHHTTCG
jgi:hypothetical protein